MLTGWLLESSISTNIGGISVTLYTLAKDRKEEKEG
jgi:hypothetical protein